MKLTLLTLFISLLAFTAAQECGEAPEGALDGFGKAIGPFPKDIPKGCSAFEILVARGTSEPNYEVNGKFGIVVGDPVVSNTTLKIPGARGYPVQYPASANIFGALQGSNDVVSRITSQSRACPTQKFALVGYSQGAGVIHSAGGKLSTALKRKIVAVVTFGDPYTKRSGGSEAQWPTDLRPKALNICAPGDPVCDKGSCFFNHLTYIRPEYINKAVDFIVTKYNSS